MTAARRKAVHVLVRGRVQGVGFRAWTAAEAGTRGLDGWVRNRRDGAVEAVLAGPPAVVDAMVDALRRGPRDARVEEVVVVGEGGHAGTGFAILPTA